MRVGYYCLVCDEYVDGEVELEIRGTRARYVVKHRHPYVVYIDYDRVVPMTQEARKLLNTLRRIRYVTT